MPDVYGQQYEAIPTDRVFPYSQSNPPPNCDDGGQTQAPYDEVAGNAFYCSNGDFVAYDEQGLLPKLREQLRRVRGGPRVRPRARPRGAGARRLQPVGDRVHRAAGRLLRRRVGAARRRQRRRERAPLDGRPRHRARRSAHPERPVGHRRCAGRRARQRLRPGQRVPGRLRGRRGDVRRLPEQPARRHRVRLHELPGPGDRRQPAARRAGCRRSPRASTSTGASQSSKLTAPDRDRRWRDAARRRRDGGVLTDAVTYDPSTNTVHYDAATLQDVHDIDRRLRQRHARWRPRGRRRCEHQLGATRRHRRPPAAAPSAWPARGRRAPRRRCRPATSTKRSRCWSRRARATPTEGTAFDRVAAFRAGFKHGPSKCVQSS